MRMACSAPLPREVWEDYQELGIAFEKHGDTITEDTSFRLINNMKHEAPWSIDLTISKWITEFSAIKQDEQ